MAGFYSSKVNTTIARAAEAGPATRVGEMVSMLGRAAGSMAGQQREADAAVEASKARVAELERQRARDAASAELARRLATSEGEHARWVIDHQNDADFESAANARIESDMASLRGVLGNDPELDAHFAPILERAQQARQTAARQRGAEVRAAAGRQANEQALTAFRNNAATSPDRAAEFADAYDAAIMANGAIPAELRPLVARAGKGGIWQDALGAAIRSGRHEAVAAELDKGTYNEVLPEGARTALLNLARAQGHAAEAAAATAAREKEAAAKAAVDLIQRQVGAGIDPSDADLKAASDMAAAAGLPLESFDVADIAARVAVNRQYRGKSAIERNAAIEELAARQNAGRASAAEQVALDQLRKLDEAKAEDDAKPLRDMFGQGLAGRMQAAAQMQALPLAQRHALAEKVRPGFGAYVALPEGARRAALAGMDDRVHIKDPLEPKVFVPRFRAALGGVERVFSGKALEGLREVTENIYAHFGRDKTGYDHELFKVALNMALGARNEGGTWRGGLGEYRGAKLLLPNGKTQGEFDGVVQAYDFSAARDPAGKVIPKNWITSRMRPVYVDDSANGRSAIYVWEDEAGNRLKDAAGRDFRMGVPH